MFVYYIKINTQDSETLMLEEKKETVELKEEDLDKVNGGSSPKEFNKSLYCPDCDYLIGYISTTAQLMAGDDMTYCPNCNKWVIPI